MRSTPRQRGATYLAPGVSDLTYSRHSFLRLFVPLILALGVLAGTLSLGVASQDSIRQAYAADCEGEEECDEATLDSAMNKGDYSPTDKGFDQLMDDLAEAESSEGGVPQDSILYAFKRHFTIGYMNEGNQARIGSEDFEDESLEWYSDIFKARGKTNCGTGWKAGAGEGKYYPGEQEGSIFWHNCDVPNLVTEFAQDMSAIFFSQGVQGGETRNVATQNTWFGYPWTMPDEIERNSSDQVTALEVFGYNLRYTSYRGEWDHIKVMTSARALSNFGFLDRLKLSAQAVLNGILGGVDSAVNGLIDDLKSGNIVRLVTSPGRFISNFFTGTASATVDTVIDTSDTNVFATMSWYRPEFGSTLYNARQLSQEEISVFIEKQFIQYMKEARGDLEDADPPEDLAAIAPEKLRQLDPPSSGRCSGSYTARRAVQGANSAGDTISGSAPNNSSATETEQVCRNYVRGTGEAAHPGYTVSVNSVNYLPAKTVGEWSDQSGWQGPVEKYQILCELDLSSPQSSDVGVVQSFINCLEDDNVGYGPAVRRETRNEQVDLNLDWYSKTFEEAKLADYFREQSATFVSANARYVCLNPDGTDMLDGSGDYVRLVIGSKNNQRMNPECAPVRKPIQNGLFGNGYYDGVGVVQPPVDTRREAFGFSLWDLFYQDEVLANSGLAVTVFATRMSNTFLNLSFSPILEASGLDDIVTNLIIALRDSLFFPLALIVVAFVAISAFFQAGVRRDYGNQFKNLLIMTGLFIFGSVLLLDPARTIRFVDEAPAQVEAVIIGAVFEIDNQAGDNLCESGENTGGTGTDSFGNRITFNPEAATRNLLCENWNVFALRPYVYGQWGTSYDDLNYENFQAQGDQAQLVGNGDGDAAPFVSLGGGGLNAERNWALYQLDVMTAGTVTTEDSIQGNTNSSDLYRLVDLQAGPGGELEGAPYADEYFEMWRGDQMGQRIMVSWLSAIMAIVGAATVFFFAWAKIFISLLSVLMVLFLPIMLLIGLFPNKGTFKLKGYFLQILSLMVQRVVLVGLIALMLRIITSVAQSTNSYLLFTVITLITCIAFLMMRKELLGIFDKSIVSSSGGFGQSMKGQVMDNVPFGRSVGQQVQLAKSAARGTAYGAMGGFINNGFAGAKSGGGAVADHSLRMMKARQARSGLGAGLVAVKAGAAGAEHANTQAKEYMEDRLKPILATQVRADFKAAGLTDEEISPTLVQEQVKKELAALQSQSSKGKATRNMNKLRRAEESLLDRPGEISEKELRSNIKGAKSSDPLTAMQNESDRAQGLRPTMDASGSKQKRYLDISDAVEDDMVKAFLATRDLDDLNKEARIVRDKNGGEALEPAEDAFTKEYLRESARRMSQTFQDKSMDDITRQVDPSGKGEVE